MPMPILFFLHGCVYRDASHPSCLGTTKSRILRERKGLGLRAFNMGEAYLNEEDLHYLVNRRVQVRSEMGEERREKRRLSNA